MEHLKDQIAALSANVQAALVKIDAPRLKKEIATLQARMAEPDFWQNSQAAQQTAQRAAQLQAQLEPWQKLQSELKDMQELSAEPTLAKELNAQMQSLQNRYNDLKTTLLFNGTFDNHDALLRLSAGAGGTDAQDWTHMLQRMYLRWAEKHGIKTQLLQETPGEEAGIKSAVISLSGPYAYGKLRSEHGVHRLVRLSPFNADNLRQTSFALVEVLPQIDAPEEIALDDKDITIEVFRAGGHGGQSVNTTDSAVRVTHLPTGITVSIQNERSQLQNKETALKIVRSKLAQLQAEQHTKTLADIKGPTKSAEWGAQIRNYVLHPYTLVKDTRTGLEVRDAKAVLDGKIDEFITAFLTKN